MDIGSGTLNLTIFKWFLEVESGIKPLSLDIGRLSRVLSNALRNQELVDATAVYIRKQWGNKLEQGKGPTAQTPPVIPDVHNTSTGTYANIQFVEYKP